MRILIGCARSGIMARAFRALGWEAWECDIEPSRDVEGSNWHIQGDVLKVARQMPLDAFFAHPPCTYLSVSGLHWNKRGARVNGRPRAELTGEAFEFFMACWEIVRQVGRGGLENPIGCMSTMWRKPDQIVQPWQFGDDASKATCLWLHNVAPLDARPDLHVAPRYVNGKPRWANQTDSGQNKLAPSADRAEKRSQTYPGIAHALATAITLSTGGGVGEDRRLGGGLWSVPRGELAGMARSGNRDGA